MLKFDIIDDGNNHNCKFQLFDVPGDIMEQVINLFLRSGIGIHLVPRIDRGENDGQQ